jgi:hypothetical protein
MMTLSVTVKDNAPKIGWPLIISSYPMLLGAIMLLVLLITKEKWEEALRRIYPTGADTLPTDEVLDPYFDALPSFAKQWWFMEEVLCRD